MIPPVQVVRQLAGPQERGEADTGAERSPVMSATYSYAPPVVPPSLGSGVVRGGEDPSGEEVFVETPLVKWVMRGTRAVRHGWPLVVWSGSPGSGKSATARFYARDLERRTAAGENEGIARYLLAPEIDGDAADKKLMREIHQRCIGPLSARRYREASAGDLAEDILIACEARDIRAIFIDEAGQLSRKALRSLCLLRDGAEARRWPLAVVLIGMDNLPRSVRSMPHVYRRVHAWVYFKPYDVKDTRLLLAGLHSHFAAPEPGASDAPEIAEQVAFIHESVAAAPRDRHGKSGGALPGKIAPFIAKVTEWCAEYGEPITLDLLRAVHLLSGRDEDLAFVNYQQGYVGLNGLPPEGEDGTTAKPSGSLDGLPPESAPSEPTSPVGRKGQGKAKPKRSKPRSTDDTRPKRASGEPSTAAARRRGAT